MPMQTDTKRDDFGGLPVPWHLPVINHDTMLAHLAAFQAGDTDALEPIIRHNAGFIRECVIKLYPKADKAAQKDMVHEGMLGLIVAAERFDATKGHKFITFAVWWIKQRIRVFHAEHDRPMRRPGHLVSYHKKIGTALSELYGELERDPTIEEMAEHAEISPEQAAVVWQDRHAVVRLNKQRHGGGATSSAGREEIESVFQTPDPAALAVDVVSGDQTAGLIQDAIATLDERSQRIVALYYGFGVDEPLTLEQIGATLNITRERVRQLKEKALSNLRCELPLMELA